MSCIAGSAAAQRYIIQEAISFAHTHIHTSSVYDPYFYRYEDAATRPCHWGIWERYLQVRTASLDCCEISNCDYLTRQLLCNGVSFYSFIPLFIHSFITLGVNFFQQYSLRDLWLDPLNNGVISPQDTATKPEVFLTARGFPPEENDIASRKYSDSLMPKCLYCNFNSY